MIRKETFIKDCVLLQSKHFYDHRGVFTEIYKQSELQQFYPVQTNCSISKKNVFRGIHRTPYAKLITCVKGSIYDICVDLRTDSDTYKKYFAIELNHINATSLYIPPYCGHGFLALDDSIVIYHQSEEYDSKLDETYCYKNFNISLPPEIIISDKDKYSCDKNTYLME